MEGSITTWDAHAIAKAIREGTTRAVDVTEAHLAAVERGAGLHAWLHHTAERARAQAAAIDASRAHGRLLGALAGVPFGLKDVFVTRGVPTTANSRILAGWHPPYEGTHAARLHAADAVLLGKLSLDEFAMGSSNENVPGEAVRNPWAIDRVAGGSSGGAAAAVAARMVPFALATDTGGSIRQPASLCGVVGLKPSYGRVPRSGMIAFASSLDQAGPITRSVRDAAWVLGVLAGGCADDATCVDEPAPDFTAACARGVAGLRVGVHREALAMPGLDDEVRRAFEASLAVLEAQGARVIDIELPHAHVAVATYYVLCTAEAASNLARYDGIRYGASAPLGVDLAATIEATRTAGFGPEVQRRILLGTFVLRKDSYAQYYGRAQRVRQLIADDYTQAFARCDVIATPTAPQPAFVRGGRVDDPLAMYLADVFTVGANLAGLPAISVPCGFTKNGVRLPIGLQLVAPWWREDLLFAVGAAHEDVTAWHRERPPERTETSSLAGASS